MIEFINNQPCVDLIEKGATAALAAVCRAVVTCGGGVQAFCRSSTT
jgi:hypothetical protein